MSERDLGRPDVVGHPIQHAAPQPGTQRAGRRPRVQLVIADLADRRVLAPELPAPRFARPRDRVVLVVAIAGVHVHRHQREPHRRPPTQCVEQLHQGPAVLAAGQTDHNAVAVLDQIEVDDRAGQLPRQLLLEHAVVGHRSSLLERTTRRFAPPTGLWPSGVGRARPGAVGLQRGETRVNEPAGAESFCPR